MQVHIFQRVGGNHNVQMGGRRGKIGASVVPSGEKCAAGNHFYRFVEKLLIKKNVYFPDEVDSMLCERSEQENGAARRVKTEFLIQLDGCNSGSADDRVLVLAATNRPYELDEGILRRFPKRIFIDLPDAKARASMIQRTFVTSNTPAKLSTKDLRFISLISSIHK